MAVTPAMNLDPAARAWGRWAQTELERMKREIASLTQGGLIANKSAAGSIDLLTRQVRDLEAAYALLNATVDGLAEAQASLASQQASLTVQQAYLASLSPVAVTSSIGATSLTDDAWTTNAGLRPSLSLTPSTGRIRIRLSAFLANAIGTYSIPGYITRDSRIAGNEQFRNLMVSGPAVMNASSYEWIVFGLPVGDPITIQAEIRGISSGVAAMPTLTAENIG